MEYFTPTRWPFCSMKGSYRHVEAYLVMPGALPRAPYEDF